MPTFSGELILVILLAALLLMLFCKLRKPKKTNKLSDDKSIKQSYPTSTGDSFLMAFFMLISLVNFIIIFVSEINLTPLYIALSILIFIVSGIGYLYFAMLKHPEIEARAKVFSKRHSRAWEKATHIKMTFLLASKEKMELSVDRKTYKAFNVGDTVDIKYQGEYLLKIDRAGVAKSK